jgi:hypothetical protein
MNATLVQFTLAGMTQATRDAAGANAASHAQTTAVKRRVDELEAIGMGRAAASIFTAGERGIAIDDVRRAADTNETDANP